MNRCRWFMILLLDVLGAGILWFISGADGYQIHEVLCGLAESGNSGKAVPTDLISCMRWMWVLFPPMICGAMILEWEQENRYFKIYRYTSYKKWRCHLAGAIFFQTLFYESILFGISVISSGGFMKENVISIILLSIHIWLLVMLLLLTGICKINLLTAVFLVLVLESSMILIGTSHKICDDWNIAVWSMYTRMVKNGVFHFPIRRCVAEFFIGWVFLCLSVLKKEE